MEKLTFVTDDNENVDLYVIEETRVNGINYLLVTETDDEDMDGDCYILKDTSAAESSEASYEFVEDDTELTAVGKIFEELLDEEDA
ncbi:MAG: DUF1292 domain-containing protein [Eubacteriales bacterium]|nr:DUF1292 domain-containing protein [Eubacteriales bacterium]